MPDVANTILRTIEDDPTIKALGVNVQLKKAGGLFSRKQNIHITGTIDSESTQKRILEIAQRWAGTNYEIVNELSIKQS